MKTDNATTPTTTAYPKWVRGVTQRKEGDGTYTGKTCATGAEEKIAIASYIANEVIKDTGSVFFDAGSTLRMVAQAAFSRAVTEHLSLIATTNNVDISEDFLSGHFDFSKCDVTLHLTGGKHDRNHHALFGELAAATLTNIFPECIIMGISGFTFNEGLFYHGGTEEGMVKSALYTKEVDRRVLAMEHNKLGRRDMFLCRNEGKDAIKGLCKRVRDKTIIVTSSPPEDAGKSLDVSLWQHEIAWLEGSVKNAEDGYTKETMADIEDWLKRGLLEVTVVSPLASSPYYKVRNKFPS